MSQYWVLCTYYALYRLLQGLRHRPFETNRINICWPMGREHLVSIRRFPSFRTQPLENLSHYLHKKWFLSNPAPGENLENGNLVMETGWTSASATRAQSRKADNRSARRIPYYTILYYTILYYTILYYTILYYTIRNYTTLYYTILYCTILYYNVTSYVPIRWKETILQLLNNTCSRRVHKPKINHNPL